MQNNDILSFCEIFRYPPIIRKHLVRIEQVIIANCPDIVSILLVGSTARGEFSYRVEPEGQVSLWSDIEFFVVSEKEPKPADRARLATLFQQLEVDWGKASPLFHIDCSYISLSKFRHLPTLIRHYEAKQIGKVLSGKDIRPEIPNIDTSNLDYRELAEVILWRLWAIALYIPKRLVTGERIDDTIKQKDDELFKFVLCRNALDLTTYLLPWGKILLPSFKERTKYIATHYTELKLNQYFDPAFPDYLDACLHGKFEFIFPAFSKQLYQQTISYFVQAGKHLLAVNHNNAMDGEMTNSLIKNQSQLFNEFRFRRKIYELMLIGKYISQKSVSGWWRWYWQGKIGKMISCLFHLHFAFQAITATGVNAEAETELNIAADLLTQLSLRRLPSECYSSSGSVGERWLALRKGFARFLMDLYQSVGQKQEYLNKILEK
jgi:predicted nucleotidyltransferase